MLNIGFFVVTKLVWLSKERKKNKLATSHQHYFTRLNKNYAGSYTVEKRKSYYWSSGQPSFFSLSLSFVSSGWKFIHRIDIFCTRSFIFGFRFAFTKKKGLLIFLCQYFNCNTFLYFRDQSRRNRSFTSPSIERFNTNNISLENFRFCFSLSLYLFIFHSVTLCTTKSSQCVCGNVHIRTMATTKTLTVKASSPVNRQRDGGGGGW